MALALCVPLTAVSSFAADFTLNIFGNVNMDYISTNEYRLYRGYHAAVLRANLI
jgi:hypothetical protein